MIAVGLMEGRSAVDVELAGVFTDASGMACKPARYRFTSEVTLTPSDPASCSFALEDVTIGIGFHWERKERQAFRGALRIIKRDAGLTVVNDVPLEEYVKSVISSEMSASCPIELLKAHAVISRSWLLFPKELSSPGASIEASPYRAGAPGEGCSFGNNSQLREITACALSSAIGQLALISDEITLVT